MKQVVLFLCMVLGLQQGAQAQARFVLTGKVEYEKKVNMHKYIEDNSWTREMKDRLPTYRTTYFNLYFTNAESLYKAGKEPVDDKWRNFWGSNNAEENVTYHNLQASTTTTSKQVFEKRYLLQDTAVQIEWRLTNETRNIAGFECRKAVGKMFDSLYVVAFYTEEIASSAGPEIYQGLPGLILGIAFPRFYTTWFATKVELTPPVANDMIIPSKGKKVTRTELMAQVKDVFTYGTPEEKQKGFWSIVL